MKRNEQLIAIAEACGWTHVQPWFERLKNQPNQPSVVGYHPDAEDRLNFPSPQGKDAEQRWLASVPDYLSDLNAMHEAEKTLTLHQTWMYVRKLSCIFADDPDDGLTCAIFATAAHRAEAFLRTIGKWEGGTDEP